MTEQAQQTTPTATRLEALRQHQLEGARTYGREERRLHRISWWFGVLRLVVFSVAMVCVVQGFRGRPQLHTRGVVPVTLVFAAIVVWHRRVQARERIARRRRILCVECVARVDGGTGPGAPGELPVWPASDLDAGRARCMEDSRTHAIAAWIVEDLGIDGASPSLFDLLNTVQSDLGARRLRMLLRTPLFDAAAIHRRQAATRELAANGVVRQALLLAFFAGRETPARRLAAFLAQPRALPGGWFRVLAVLCGLLTVPLLVASMKIALLLPLAASLLVVGGALRFKARHRILALRDAYLELEPVLRVALDVAHVLQAQAPDSDLLRAHRNLLVDYTQSQSAYRLQRLLRYIACLHLHEIGLLYGIIDFAVHWDLQWLLVLEAIARPERTRLERLVVALCELEAQVALGVYAAERPGLLLPEVESAAKPRLCIAGGEHPLLPHGRAVANDVDLGDAVRVEIVLGSNMAGKSTFLRMVALNVVLAQIGAPVRCTRMQLTPLALHANINVRDSLADGKSYFLVEVERVRDILRAASEQAFVLGLFDELFRGTNSVERLAASREIVRDLAHAGGLFLLATHDLELARLISDDHVPGLGALHFRDEIVDGQMVFPYRAERGAAQAHNALRLLELSGYPNALVARARAFAAERAGPAWG